jgi:hypothetical protein
MWCIIMCWCSKRSCYNKLQQDSASQDRNAPKHTISWNKQALLQMLLLLRHLAKRYQHALRLENTVNGSVGQPATQLIYCDAQPALLPGIAARILAHL